MTGKQTRRREQIPRIHRANYAKAMRGRSMKAAIKSFCLECVQWQKEEVRLCTDLACPLYPYRPYKDSSKERDNRTGFGAGRKNSRQTGNIKSSKQKSKDDAK